MTAGIKDDPPPIEPVRLETVLPQEQAKSDKFYAEHILNNPKAKEAMQDWTYKGYDNINKAQLGLEPMTLKIQKKYKKLQNLP